MVVKVPFAPSFYRTCNAAQPVRPHTLLNLDQNNRRLLRIKLPSAGVSARFYVDIVESVVYAHPRILIFRVGRTELSAVAAPD